MLKSMEKNKGASGLEGSGRNRGSKRELPLDAPPTLAELGIDKKTTMIAQQLASLPEDVREKIANQEKPMKEIPGVTEV